MSSRLQVEVSPCEVSELERQLRAREDALASCSARRARLEGDVAGLKKTVQEGGVALRRLEREQQLLAEKESSLQAHVADLEQQTGRHQKDPALAADLKATEERLNAGVPRPRAMPAPSLSSPPSIRACPSLGGSRGGGVRG